MVCSAVEFHLFVVEIHSRCTNPVMPDSVSKRLPEVERNVSTSGLLMKAFAA